jgi:hypothetical protein
VLTPSSDATRLAVAHADHASLHDARSGQLIGRIDIAEHLDDELVSIDALPAHFAITLRRTLLLVSATDFTVVARHRIDPVALTLVGGSAQRALFASIHQVFVLDLDAGLGEHTLRPLPIRSARVAGSSHGAIGRRAVAIDRDLRRALVVPSERQGTLFDLERLVPIATLPVRSARPGFDASGTRVLDGLTGTLWNASTGAPISDAGLATGAAWCADSSRFLLARRRDAWLCDEDGHRLRSIPIASTGAPLAVSANRAFCETADGLVLVDLDAGVLLASLAAARADDTEHHHVRLAVDGTRALTWLRGPSDPTVSVWALDDARRIATLPAPGVWHPKCPLVLAHTVVVVSESDSPHAFHLDTGRDLGTVDLAGHGVVDVAAIPERDSYWMLTTAGAIQRIDLNPPAESALAASNP